VCSVGRPRGHRKRSAGLPGARKICAYVSAIATGLAVVGDLIGEGRSAGARGRRRDAETLPLGWQALATPNTLGDRRSDPPARSASWFDLADLGPQQLAGFAEPQRRLASVERKSGEVNRFEALRLGGDAARRGATRKSSCCGRPLGAGKKAAKDGWR